MLRHRFSSPVVGRELTQQTAEAPAASIAVSEPGARARQTTTHSWRLGRILGSALGVQEVGDGQSKSRSAPSKWGVRDALAPAPAHCGYLAGDPAYCDWNLETLSIRSSAEMIPGRQSPLHGRTPLFYRHLSMKSTAKTGKFSTAWAKEMLHDHHLGHVCAGYNASASASTQVRPPICPRPFSIPYPPMPTLPGAR